MVDDVYTNDNETLISLGFKLHGNWNNHLIYFMETGEVQVYVDITYETGSNKKGLYRAQIANLYITEAVIKPADTLEELINNIVEGNTQDYWWVADINAAKG